MKTPILDMLKSVSKESVTRFCMPGHKGKTGIFQGALYENDITELPGADNLYMPNGAIAESQRLYAKFIGAAVAFFLVGGSTVGIHASMLSVLNPGDKLLMARDMHVSAVNAAILADADVEFVYPSGQHAELPAVVTPEDIAEAIRINPDAKAVYITYPNYYGLCCDLNEICRIAHNAGMKVICDAAHAATYDFSALTPVSPAAAGCDIWTVSLHKTLPALNQCAALCVGENADVSVSKVQSRVNMLQTTSPSYLLLGSIDYALGYMQEQGKQRLAAVTALVEDSIMKLENLGGYRCATKDVPLQTGAYDRDILRLVIDVTDRGLSGFSAARKLAREGISVEAGDSTHIILICTVADSSMEFEVLQNALRTIKGTNYNIHTKSATEELTAYFAGKPVVGLREASFAKRLNMPLISSVGCVAAVSVGVYPPGVPLLLPGQEISYEMIETIGRLRQQGYSIFGSDGNVEIANVP